MAERSSPRLPNYSGSPARPSSGRRFETRSAGPHLGGAIRQVPADLLMGEILATLKCFLAPLHRLNKTAFLVEIPRHDFLYQPVGITALLSGGLHALGFELGGKVYFHALEDTRKVALGQRY